MGDNQYVDPDEEQEEAKDRIDQILKGGASSGRAGSARRNDLDSDSLETDAIARARSRASAARAALDRVEQPKARSRARVTSGGSTMGGGAIGSQAILLIGGLVAVGILVVVVLFLIAPILRGEGGGLPFLATATPTATATPNATETPTPTLTLTPTKVAPPLALPPLTCIFQSGTGCSDYCAQAENASECNSARDFVRAQGADPDAWFRCLSPGPGPNQGNPQDCLRQAWYAANP